MTAALRVHDPSSTLLDAAFVRANQPLVLRLRGDYSAGVVIKR